MADGKEPTEPNVRFSRAVSLLREVVGILDNNSENNPEPSRNDEQRLQSETVGSNSRSQTQRINNTSSNSNAPESSVGQGSRGQNKQTILDNFRSLFSPYNQNNGPNPPKRPRGNNNRNYKVKETWTHEIFCLADISTTVVPSRAVKFQLQLANLGRKKIVFGWKDNPFQFKAKLEEMFPKLVNGGGFEILRSGVNVQSLVLISPPPAGYSVAFLRDNSGLGQALAYVRPAQRNLDMSEISSPIQSASSYAEAPTVACLNCGQQIALTQIKEHTSICSKPKEPEQVPESEATMVSNTADVLYDMFPILPKQKVLSTLTACEGNVDDAALQLLVNTNSDSSDDELLLDTFLSDTRQFRIGHIRPSGSSTASSSATSSSSCAASSSADDGSIVIADDLQPVTPQEGLHIFREQNKATDKAPQRIYVNRFQEDFESDILALYKSPKFKLQAKPRVRFESEAGVGPGPVREFFTLALQLVENGITNSGHGKVMIFEGSKDHKLPVVNNLMKQAGLYITIGKIMAHSILHGGPAYYGLSPSVIHYWTVEDVDNDPLPLCIEDIPDYELRTVLHEIDSCHVTGNQKDTLMPYLLEAGLPLLTDNNVKITMQNLIWYNVFERRKHILDDIAQGLEKVSLISFLKRHPITAYAFFPRENDRIILPNTINRMLNWEAESDHELKIAGFFTRYISDVAEGRSTDVSLKDLVCFWTGVEVLPTEAEQLVVRFPSDEEQLTMPFSKTCFNTITLPVMYGEYAQFKEKMDMALRFGNKGFSEI